MTTGSFPHDNFSSVYWIFTKLGHMIPLYFGVITIIPFDNLYRQAYFVMHIFLVYISNYKCTFSHIKLQMYFFLHTNYKCTFSHTKLQMYFLHIILKMYFFTYIIKNVLFHISYSKSTFLHIKLQMYSSHIRLKMYFFTHKLQMYFKNVLFHTQIAN